MIERNIDSSSEPAAADVAAELHRRLKIQPAARGVSLQVLTDAVLAIGLRHLDEADTPPT